MDILILMVISVAVFFLVQKLSKATRVAAPIWYLALGIVAGVLLNVCGLGNVNTLFPNIGTYNSVAMLLMFFSAGFSVNINQIKKSGKLTAKLFSIPAYVETVLMSVIMFLLLKFGGSYIGMELSYVECLAIAAILAVASPANIVPLCVNMMQTGYTDKNNIPGTMLAVSVVDGFITTPVVMVAVFISIAANTGAALSPLMVVGLAVGILIGIIVVCIAGIGLGRIVSLAVNPVLNKIAANPTDKQLPFIGILVAYILSAAIVLGLGKIPTLGMVMGMMGILVICVMGATIKHCDKTGASMAVSQKGNMLFGILGMPIVFMYVGARMDINVLFNPVMLLIGVACAVLAFVIKGIVTKALLKGDQFTDGERKFAAACFIPKGVTLINFSVIFVSVLGEGNMTQFMTMLAAIVILVTMTYGMTVLNRAKGRWIFKAQ